MKDRWTSWIQSVARIIDKLLPESRFKEFLRSNFLKRYSNLNINLINKIVSKAELLEDDILFVELDDGAKFCVPRTKVIPFEIRYGDPQRLGKMKGFEYFDCWGELYRQYVRGVYEEYHKLKRGDIVIDAGAHIGVFTVKTSRIVGKEGKIITIEPEPNNVSFLRRNIEVNGLRNVTVVPKGIWSKSDKLKLYLSNCIGRHSVYPQWADSNRYVEVEVDSLDNILRELGVKRVDFIKMNIEGAEIEALKGIEETLKINDDVKLAIAAHHLINGKETYKTIIRQLEEKGFKINITSDRTVWAWRE